jgi:bacteriocin-like protein
MKPPLRELISPKLSLNCGDEIMSKSNDTTKVRELTEAELAAVSGGYGNVWMACYLTVRHTLNDMDKRTFEALSHPVG